MKNKLKRIILDLEDFAGERYLNYEASNEIKRVVSILENLNVYSTEL